MNLHILSSAIQVSLPGPGEMVVYFPHDVGWSNLLILAMGLVMAPVGVWLVFSRGNDFMTRFMGLFTFLPLFFALYTMTFCSTLTFSRASHTVVVAESYFFIPSTTTYALKDVDHAEVAEDDGHSHMLYLALASQDRIPMGEGWTPRNGYFQAASAVNVFLNKSRTPAEATPAAADAGDYSPAGMEALGQRDIARARAANKQAQH